MTDARFPTTPAHRHVAADSLPTLTIKQLETDPHGAFQACRTSHALARHESGNYFVLRFADIERLSRDPRCRGQRNGHS
jgi:hypothetical protein